ncbi:hypothetical protein [Siphonobacter aquaeclarae]|uniref:Uncharacterized protein n=1 Tax=Siphonobacter aquaeclarae TaxID=563176 RepID=A0A1G9T8S5_9BACT|nr:hypothetical protein [Siphonobacter aquaeclarae]SDM44057.1 hypothetical protein SAMN04488090_3460 [Siphonobacter aquaeclarae]
MLVQFNQFSTNLPLAVNPAHVVGIVSAPLWLDSEKQTDAPVTQIHTTYDVAVYAVTESLSEVVKKLNLSI